MLQGDVSGFRGRNHIPVAKRARFQHLDKVKIPPAPWGGPATLQQRPITAAAMSQEHPPAPASETAEPTNPFLLYPPQGEQYSI